MSEPAEWESSSYVIDSDVLIDHLIGALTRLNVNGVIARKAGEYRALYRPSHGMALPDALIAATAFVHQSALITRNTRHYPMSDIQVVMPFEMG